MEDINIKINVDAKESTAQVINYKKYLKELKDAMAALEIETNGLKDATEEQRRGYATLEEEAAKIKDALGDVNQRIAQGADDFATFSAVLEGMGAATAVVQGLAGQLELLGVTNVGAENLTKTFIALQGQLNAINQVQKVFNKDSRLMQQIQGTLGNAISAGGKSMKVATVAQKGLNAAMKAAPYIAIAAAIIEIVTALYSFIESTREASGEQKTFHEETDKATQALITQNSVIERKNRVTKEGVKQFVEWATSSKRSVSEQSAALKEFTKMTGLQVNSISELKTAYNYWLNNISPLQDELSLLNATNEHLNKTLEECEKQMVEFGVDTESAKEIHKEFNNVEGLLSDGISMVAEKTAQASAKTDVWNKKHQASTQITKQNTDAVENNTKALEESATIQQQIATMRSQINKEVYDDEEKTYEGRKKHLEQQIADEKSFFDAEVQAMRFRLGIMNDNDAESNEEYQEWLKTREELLNEHISNIRDKQKENDDNEQERLNRIYEESEERRKQEYEQEKAHQEQLKELKISTAQEAFSGIYSVMDSAMSAELDMAEGNEKKQKQIRQKYAVANLVVNTAESAAALAVSIPKTLAAYSEIPFAGPVLAAIQIAATTATIAAQIANIKKQKGEIMKAARGAFIVGPSHSQGGVTMEVEGGEAVLNKRAMAIPEYRALASYMNTSTGGVAFPGGSASAGAPIAATIDRNTIREIVNEVASIPVVVSEGSITSTQRRVSSIEGRSRL